MKVLVIGSGGREHALAWKIAQSPLLEILYCAPGNPGISEVSTLASIDTANNDAVLTFCRENSIDLVIVGPEAPLVDGLADLLRMHSIACFGPGKEAARLEGSKTYTKEVCADHDIPTAAWEHFNNAPKAKAYVRQNGAPIVIKADGLAAGKGVTVAQTVGEACDAIDDCFEGAFGDSGIEIVVEECLIGEEASFFCLCDGKTALPLVTAQDHKRLYDGDVGPNTGGMGAYSPAPVMTSDLIDEVMETIIHPTMKAMAKRNAPFIGVLYAGLMITGDGPKLIEYNVRFGDPECQVLMMRMASDILPLLDHCAKGTLEGQTVSWHDGHALSVVMAADGYPVNPKKGGEICGIKEAQEIEGVQVFHAGTGLKDGQLIATGGRVLNVTGSAPDLATAYANVYQAIEKIQWSDGIYRRDIAHRALNRK